MKKLTIAMMMILAATMIIVSCGGPGTKKNPEGWVDDDTFRVRVTGYSQEDDDRKWKTTAKMAAEINATEAIMRKMVGSYIESTGATEDAELIGRVVREKAAGTIVGVQIIEVVEEDPDTKSVTLIAQVQQDGLKKMMDKRIKQYFDELSESGVGPDTSGDPDAGNGDL